MTVADNQVVSITYVLKDDEGVLIDQSGDDPLVYLHGHRNIVPGLEKALSGLKKGEKASARVTPGEGYGEYDPQLKFPLPKDKLGDEIPPVGSVLQIRQPGGEAFMARVVEAGEEALTVDANHPLAGVTLNFEVVIQDIREAQPDELAHGHVHGPGCHH